LAAGNLGDVLILGTDGLWDNVFDDAIAAEVAAHMAARTVSHSGMQLSHDLAHRLARKAFTLGSSANARTPFWTKPGAPREGRGGKLDDITVLVAIAGSASPPDSPRREP